MHTFLAPLLAVDLENMPGLPPGVLPWILAGLALTWVALRVWVLRSRLAQLHPGDPAPPAPRWLLSLARSPAALPVLLALVAGCAWAVFTSF